MDVDDDLTPDDYYNTEVVASGRFYVQDTEDIDFPTTPRLWSGEWDQQLALPNSENSSAIIPYEGDSADQYTRHNKRHRLLYDQANAALEVPTRYWDVCQPAEAPKWFQAIQEEIKALEKKSTWTGIKDTPSQKAIGTKWVFSNKTDDKGDVQSYKWRGSPHLVIVRKKGKTILRRTLQLQI